MIPTLTPKADTPSPAMGEGVTLDDILQAAHACLLDREPAVRQQGCTLIGDVASLILSEPEIPDAAYNSLVAVADRLEDCCHFDPSPAVRDVAFVAMSLIESVEREVVPQTSMVIPEEVRP